MLPTLRQRVERIRESIDELEHAGIAVLGVDEAALRRLVRTHADFLQCMLGCDASCQELVELIRSQRPVVEAEAGTLH
jgi:methionine synthase II (cobalamin-independent)